MNILASPLPETVAVGEASVRLKTGYRTGIQVARVADSDLSDLIKAGAILRLYFGDDVPSDKVDALEAVMRFHRRGTEPPKRTAPRVLDWDHDAGRIPADFRREYDIDLADPATRLHWWVFMAYLDNLSNGAEIKQAMYYRGPQPRDLTKAERPRWNKLQKAYALPPRTLDDAIARDAALWGD